MKRIFLITALIVACAAGIFWPSQRVLSRILRNAPDATDGTRIVGLVDEVPMTPVGVLQSRLIKAGWDKTGAMAFAALCEEASLVPVLLSRDGLMVQLTALGKTPEVVSYLARHPETAGVLARLRSPELLIKALASVSLDAQRQRLLGSCLVFTAHGKLDAWTEALAAQAPLISLLLEQHRVDAIAPMFVFDRSSSSSVIAATASYDDWLRSLLTSESGDLIREEKLLLARASFADSAGPSLRKELITNPSFAPMLTQVWPQLRNVIDAQAESKGGPVAAWLPLCGRPGLWKYLQRPEALPLFRDHGVLAVEWLDGETPVAPPVERTMILALQQHRLVLAAGLMRYGANPHFQTLCHQLDMAMLEKACFYLMEKIDYGAPMMTSDSAKLLPEWAKDPTNVSDDLDEDIGWWPGAEVLHVVGKFGKGRIPWTSELGWAVWDGIQLAEMFSPSHGTVTATLEKLGRGLFGAVAKDLAKQVGKAAAEAIASAILKQVIIPESVKLLNLNPPVAGARSATLPTSSGQASAIVSTSPAYHSDSGDDLSLVESTRIVLQPAATTSSSANEWLPLVQHTATAAIARPRDYRAWQRHLIAAALYQAASAPQASFR